ncbi:MAG: RNA methyltransferase [Gammaproteobacteria bacterium]|nr:RNA methyltransferase [Gammaproteobacteria bacterium]
MLANTRIVLVGTSHPGNIGAAARAMKNMGLDELYLVEPKFFPHADAVVRASGADDVLEQAQVVATLEDAVADCTCVFGTSARQRALPIPLLNPAEAAEQALEATEEAKIAFVFGRERTGLINEELARCHFHVHIPTVDDFSSLNLAASVQVIAYELYMRQHQHPAGSDSTKKPKQYDKMATAADMAFFYEHLEQTLTDIEFLRPANSNHLMRRLRRFFNRAQPERLEMNILRGILTKMQQAKGE